MFRGCFGDMSYNMFRACFGYVSGILRGYFVETRPPAACVVHVPPARSRSVPSARSRSVRPFPFRPSFPVPLARLFPFRPPVSVPFVPVPPVRSRYVAVYRRSTKQTEQKEIQRNRVNIYWCRGGVLHTSSQPLPFLLQACNAMLYAFRPIR